MATTTRETIGKWFDEGVARRMRFMSIYCDTYDYSDYPVYSVDVDDYWKTADDQQYSFKNMQRLMEVYDLSMPREPQLMEHRASHPPERPVKVHPPDEKLSQKGIYKKDIPKRDITEMPSEELIVDLGEALYDSIVCAMAIDMGREVYDKDKSIEERKHVNVSVESRIVKELLRRRYRGATTP